MFGFIRISNVYVFDLVIVVEWSMFSMLILHVCLNVFLMKVYME